MDTGRAGSISPCVAAIIPALPLPLTAAIPRPGAMWAPLRLATQCLAPRPATPGRTRRPCWRWSAVSTRAPERRVAAHSSGHARGAAMATGRLPGGAHTVAGSLYWFHILTPNRRRTGIEAQRAPTAKRRAPWAHHLGPPGSRGRKCKRPLPRPHSTKPRGRVGRARGRLAGPRHPCMRKGGLLPALACGQAQRCCRDFKEEKVLAYSHAAGAATAALPAPPLAPPAARAAESEGKDAKCCS